MAAFSGKITPFLWFDTEAEEAARYYVSIFPDSDVTGVSHYPETGPEGFAGKVMTVGFKLCGLPFTALNAGPVFKFNEAVSFYVNCDDQAEVDAYWDKLLDGGKELDCGWVKDRYGLCWQIIPKQLTEALSDADPERAARAMGAMMTMQKIDVKKIQDAADGR